jgi:hypothetical protein
VRSGGRPGGLARVGHVLRARLALARRTGVPFHALGFHAGLGTLFALLVRDALLPYPYVLVALATGSVVLALPVLADLGALLRHDEGGEWIAAQPILARERVLARVLHALLLLGAFVLAWYAPWSLCAPSASGAAARWALPCVGFALAVALSASLVWLQQLLLARAPFAFVLLETGLYVAVIATLLAVLGQLDALAALAPGREPSAWLVLAPFARAVTAPGWNVLAPSAVLALALASLLGLPSSEPRPASTRAPLERLLGPARWLALCLWVRREERASFELVYAALPREREFVLRTFPVLGIPLAFLWVGASGAHASGEPWRADLLALLFFTVGVYLPVLLVHVPLSESAEAAWILRTAPRAPRALSEGALKALFVRWVVPLYAALFVLALALGQAGLLVRLWPVSLLATLALLRLLYPRCVRDLPLSVPPGELRSDVDWAGVVAPLALALTVLAVLANRFLAWPAGLTLAAVLCALELGLHGRLGRAPGRAQGG